MDKSEREFLEILVDVKGVCSTVVGNYCRDNDRVNCPIMKHYGKCGKSHELVVMAKALLADNPVEGSAVVDVPDIDDLPQMTFGDSTEKMVVFGKEGADYFGLDILRLVHKCPLELAKPYEKPAMVDYKIPADLIEDVKAFVKSRGYDE